MCDFSCFWGQNLQIRLCKQILALSVQNDQPVTLHYAIRRYNYNSRDTFGDKD